VDMTGLVEKKTSRGTRYYENEDGEIAAKECSKCEVIKTVDRFTKDRGGLNSCCKECKRKYRQENKERIAEHMRKYRQENKERIAEKDRKYKQENKERIAEYQIKYQQENEERIAEYTRKYKQENKEIIAERDRKYRQENKEHFRKYRQENKERMRKYRQENKERTAEYNRKYRQENKERIREYQRKHSQENPHVEVIIRQRRRARKNLLPDTLTKDQLEEITDRFHGGCALTGCTDGTHLDHVIPIAIGHGGTTRQNMIPLRADLNNSKYARCIFDWFYDVKDHFNLPQTKFDELIEYLADINGMTADEYEDYVRGCHDNQR